MKKLICAGLLLIAGTQAYAGEVDSSFSREYLAELGTGELHQLSDVDKSEVWLQKNLYDLGVDIYREDRIIKLMLRDRIVFDDGSFVVRDDAQGMLSLLSQFIGKGEKFKTLIAVHSGPDSDQERLLHETQKRAAKLRGYFVREGVSPRTVSAEGFGSELPYCSNDTEYGRLCNSRIEILFVF